MKILRYITMFAAVAGLCVSCQDLEEVMTLDPSQIQPPVLNPFDVESVEVTNETLNETLTFAWDAAQFGVRTQVNYSIEAAYGDSEKVVLFSGLHGTSASITYEDLNYNLGLDPKLGGLGVPLDTPTEVDFYISAGIGSSPDKYYSEPRALTMTVIYAEPVYPTVWVIGDYCGWEHNSSQHLFSFNYDANYEGVINFGSSAANGFKITGAANWENSTGNWGYEGNDGPEAETITLTNGASTNILLYSRTFYSFKYNTSTRVLTKQMAFDKVTCTLNGAEEDMLFNPSNQCFYLDKTLAETDRMVFTIVDGDNRTVLGSTENEKLNGGEADEITAGVSGQYRIVVNLNNSADRTYRFSTDLEDVPVDPDPGTDPDPEPTNTWGIVGGPNVWGESPDLAMAEENGFFVYKGLELEAGVDMGFKIRFNNKWNDAANYGVTTDDPVVIGLPGNPVESSGGSKNMYVTEAGTFDIYFNLEGKVVYVMNAGDEAPVFETWGIWINGQAEETDDIVMTQEGDWYVAKGVEMTGETAKIRFGFKWDQSYGTATSYAGGFPTNEAVILQQGGADNNINLPVGTYDIWFDPDNGVIYANDAGEDAPASVSWGIVGDITGWGQDADLTMIYENGSYVCRNVIFMAQNDNPFKIRVVGSEWNAAYSGSYAGPNNAFSVYSTYGDNIKVPAGAYDIWFNAAGKTVTLSPVGGSYVADWYLYGNFNGNTSDWVNVEMSSASSNVAAYRASSVAIPDDGQFLFKSGDESQWIGPDRTMAAGSDPYTLTIGAAFATSADKVNARIPAGGTYDFWYLPGMGKAYVTEAGVLPEYVPDTWGICGNITGWGDLGDLSMTDNGDGTYTRADLQLSVTDEFKIRFGNAWERQYTVNGVASEGSNPTLSDGGNTKVPEDGVYDITLDVNNSTIILEKKQ